MERELQLYPVREELKEDAVGTLEKIARIGYRNTGFASYTAKSILDAAFPWRPRRSEKFLKTWGIRLFPSRYTR